MAHPRAVYPPSIVPYYRAHGYKATCAKYRTGWGSLRRYLTEQGVTVRAQGSRIRLQRGAA